VLGWPFYEVSSLGRVRSVDQMITDKLGRTRKQYGRMKKTWVDSGGYRRVELAQDGVRFGPGVHRLMLLSFVGPPQPGQEVRHLDGDSLNNCLSNLAWGTHSENIKDMQAHGTFVHRNAIKTKCGTCDGPFTGRNSKGDRICHPCKARRQREYVERRRAAQADAA
jgi:hypothetical protein